MEDMKRYFDRALPYLLLCACLTGTLWAAGTDTQEEARAAAATAQKKTSFAGEVVPLRAYLPDEPAWHGALGLWKTHDGLDMECESVRAVCAGEIVQIERDVLWGVSIETETEGSRIVYRSLDSACVREGQAVERGDLLGTAGAAPCEAELGRHVHIEYICSGDAADPYPLLRG